MRCVRSGCEAWGLLNVERYGVEEDGDEDEAEDEDADEAQREHVPVTDLHHLLHPRVCRRWNTFISHPRPPHSQILAKHRSGVGGDKQVQFVAQVPVTLGWENCSVPRRNHHHVRRPKRTRQRHPLRSRPHIIQHHQPRGGGCVLIIYVDAGGGGEVEGESRTWTALSSSRTAAR